VLQTFLAPSNAIDGIPVPSFHFDSERSPLTQIDHAALENALRDLALFAPGPGGAVGVVHEGRTVAEHAWGYADMARRLDMTTRTLMPICSISKQFTCGVLLDLVGDPSVLDDRVAGFLPRFRGRRPSVAELCHNQSGLRDYWALTVLHGADPEGVFGREDARPLLARMQTGHFEPGSSYSYSNGNFRMLSDMLEERAARSLGDLYRDRIFGPAGMETAVLTPDTSQPAGATVGYEGNATVGYFPATNRIYWTGDAGISASLTDMLAWEHHIDATRDDATSLYRRLSAPPTFADGAPASYGFGLAHEQVAGLEATGHGGALRGFRLQRLHVPARRLSVVVLFNHESDAHAAALAIARAALGERGAPPGAKAAEPGWAGAYMDPATDLVLRLDPGHGGLRARYAATPDRLQVDADGVARSADMTLTRDGEAVRMERPGENLRTTATRLSGKARPDIEGSYRSGEIEGSLEIVSTGGVFYGGFEGLLGRGGMQPVLPLAEDVWLLPCRRSMDAPAPGDWTIRVRREADGAVKELTVGCWLARRVDYARA
jgi:D-aminopeptidase